jgi:Fe2+ or Zn2+ uptake regulation protein
VERARLRRGVAHDHPHAADHTHALPAGDAVLRTRGRRLTRQRRMIWEVLAAEPDRHLSAHEVCERVRATVPSVTPSTVYRTLDVLVEAGLALRTDLGEDRVFYEPAHEHPHHHLVCERCGAVRHVHDEVLGDLGARVEASSGYALAGREITLFGTCPDCRGAS